MAYLLNIKQQILIMKSFLLLPIALITFLTTYGQLNKKTWLVGGNGSFYTSKTDVKALSVSGVSGVSRETSVNISPNLGIFVIDRLAVGLRPFVTLEAGKFTPNDPSFGGGSGRNNRFGIGPFLRYYFLEKERQLNLVSEASYQIGVYKSLGGTEGGLNRLSFLAGPAIYFNSSVGLELLLGYRRDVNETNGFYKDTKSGFSANIGFQIHLKK
jgi:hypothetical protein